MTTCVFHKCKNLGRNTNKECGVTFHRASEGSTGTPEKSVGNEAPAAPAPGPDVGVPGASRNPQQVAAQRRLQQTQAQVDEVVDLMKTNVEKVLERDHKLNELELRADGLEAGASQFEKQAKSLKSKFWLENMKMIIVGVVVLGLIIILIYWFSGASSVVDAVMSKDSPPTTAQPVTTPHEKTDAPQKLAETNSGSASLPVKVLESPKIASTFDVLKVLAKDLGIGND